MQHEGPLESPKGRRAVRRMLEEGMWAPCYPNFQGPCWFFQARSGDSGPLGMNEHVAGLVLDCSVESSFQIEHVG